MDKLISCCGANCGECEYYPEECSGCNIVEGKVFWLEYTDHFICPIYDCCINTKMFPHCGNCEFLPCINYSKGDPLKTKKQNEEILNSQLYTLKMLS